MRTNLKSDKGVAGTSVLLGLIVALFLIGLLVMIFAIMGGALITSSYTATTVTVTNETGAYVNSSNYTVDNSGALNFRTFTITQVTNSTNGTAGFLLVVDAANYTALTSGVTNATAFNFNSANISYTYVYDAQNTATGVINNTTNSISTVTTFFSLFIVIGSMVVLILLTVIIIVAIRQSGLLEGTATA